MNAIKFEETQKSGKYKDGKYYSERILEIGYMMKRDHQLAKDLLDQLLKSELPSVLSSSCVYALLVDYRTQTALKILKEIAKGDNGITSGNAEVTIELFNSGELFELHGIERYEK
ncbi:hypothetical protein FZC79_15085 [Rossellomorea vietnamensis]|uniref:Uncharacterized protein n=1 Tax=Rossellomorea vietnamensis TaxID=218284 RepID=A0A5D4KAJ9_9BACI|nr:hypothetical protein [Rossellomorea vietnamensis]TYR74404.1 hypothetical protein FZC79_15085 [Rossellomorea vietnamensis]